MTDHVRASAVMLAFAAEELRRVGCAGHDSRAILAGNRAFDAAHSLLAELPSPAEPLPETSDGGRTPLRGPQANIRSYGDEEFWL
jgi:hypothetical protein